MHSELDSNRMFRWTGLTFLAIGLLLGVLFVVLGLVTNKTEAGQARTTGVVVYAQMVSGRDEDGHVTSTRRVIIQYEVDGTVYRTIESSTRSVGDTVTIVYEARYPDRGHPAGSARVFWILAAALAVPFTVIGLVIWLRARAGTDWSAVSRRTTSAPGWRWGHVPGRADEPVRSSTAKPGDDEYLRYPTSPPDTPPPVEDSRDLR